MKGRAANFKGAGAVYFIWAGVTWQEIFGGNMTAGIKGRCVFQAGSFPGGIFFLAAKWNLPHSRP